MPITQRAIKKAYSQKAEEARRTRFTNIVNRQEGLCWYCNEVMGLDCTREHLLSQALGGKNDYPKGNLKAAHKGCNIVVGHLPVKQKIRLREIGHAEGREEMYRVATQMRRADARIAFSTIPKQKKSGQSKSNAYWRKLGLTEKPDLVGRTLT